MEPIEIIEADLDRDDHRHSVLELINAYARDPMGNGQPLPSRVKNELIPGLRNHPTTLIFLAWCDGRAVGIAVCFIGFSTFAARPLRNGSPFGKGGWGDLVFQKLTLLFAW
jgi:hypothetical protein